jgi:phospholipase/carboxylesterase
MSDHYHFAEVAAPQGAPLLFLFHGTGGNENDLIGLGKQLLPAAHLISPRGDVSEGGALRFFKRTGEGIFDMADFERAQQKVSAFVAEQIERVRPSFVAALGYSNGANTVAALLFNTPQAIDVSVLMHPLIPFAPAPQPSLSGRKVLITAGRQDRLCPAPETEKLGAYFEDQGADLTLFWHEGGHQIRQEELRAVKEYLGAEVRS